jgi:hypothetical protein
MFLPSGESRVSHPYKGKDKIIKDFILLYRQMQIKGKCKDVPVL